MSPSTSVPLRDEGMKNFLSLFTYERNLKLPCRGSYMEGYKMRCKNLHTKPLCHTESLQHNSKHWNAIGITQSPTMSQLVSHCVTTFPLWRKPLYIVCASITHSLCLSAAHTWVHVCHNSQLETFGHNNKMYFLFQWVCTTPRSWLIVQYTLMDYPKIWKQWLPQDSILLHEMIDISWIPCMQCGTHALHVDNVYCAQFGQWMNTSCNVSLHRNMTSCTYKYIHHSHILINNIIYLL